MANVKGGDRKDSHAKDYKWHRKQPNEERVAREPHHQSDNYGADSEHQRR
jgi:hypothetical protein